MERRSFLVGTAAVGVWSAPIVRSVHLTAAAGSPPPHPPEEPPRTVTLPEPAAPPEVKTTGRLAYTGDNIARDAAVGAATVAAGIAALRAGVPHEEDARRV